MNEHDTLVILNLIDQTLDLTNEEKNRLAMEFMLMAAWWIASDHDWPGT